MGYYIEQGEPLQDALRRIAAEQLNRAINETNDTSSDRNQVIHQVRKRCKKVRGLLRLVRPGIDFYSEENKALRNASRRLSRPRDLEVMAETYDLVLDHYAEQVDRSQYGNIRRRLTLEKQATVDSEKMDERLSRFHADLIDIRHRVDDWQLDKSAGKAIAKGIAKTYSRAVSAMHQAYDDPSPANFHEWRKRAKYHWYHARLLKEYWPTMLKAYRDEVKRVSSALGTHHDLAVLAEKLRNDRDMFGDDEHVETLAKLAEELADELAGELRQRGSLVFGAKPKRVGKVARQLYRSGVVSRELATA